MRLHRRIWRCFAMLCVSCVFNGITNRQCVLYAGQRWTRKVKNSSVAMNYYELKRKRLFNINIKRVTATYLKTTQNPNPKPKPFFRNKTSEAASMTKDIRGPQLTSSPSMDIDIFEIFGMIILVSASQKFSEICDILSQFCASVLECKWFIESVLAACYYHVVFAWYVDVQLRMDTYYSIWVWALVKACESINDWIEYFYIRWGFF